MLSGCKSVGGVVLTSRKWRPCPMELDREKQRTASGCFKLLALAQYGLKRNDSTTRSSQFASCELLITILAVYLRWLIEILVTNVIEHIKLSKSKQRAGKQLLIFLHAVLHWHLACLYQLPLRHRSYQQCCYASKQVRMEKFLEIWLCLRPAQDPTQIFEQVRLKGLLMFLHTISTFFPVPHCTSSNTCPARQHKP